MYYIFQKISYIVFLSLKVDFVNIISSRSSLFAKVPV